MCTVSAVTDPVSVEDALAHVLSRAKPLPGEPVAIADAAWRVLAEDARAVVDLPRFPSSAMDGFALRSADTPGTLPCVAHVAAGKPAPRPLGAGEAMGIATGGVVPEGADAVVPIELVTERDGTVQVPAAVEPAANVRPLGGDVRAGDRVVQAGTTLSPSRLAALAAAGVAHPTCGARPRVAVVTTGTELRFPGEPLGDGEIYESNGVMLAAVFRSAGGEVAAHETASDDAAVHRTVLERGLEADVLVTSGGVSVGPHDLVRGLLRELEVEQVFWGVAVKPGKPVAFGVRDRTLVFGLPGNPVSSLVACELFVRPALLALQGAAEPGPVYAEGRLARGVRRNARRDEFLRARVQPSDDGVVLEPLTGQESHMIARAAAADALVYAPRGDGELAAGERVRYLPLA